MEKLITLILAVLAGLGITADNLEVPTFGAPTNRGNVLQHITPEADSTYYLGSTTRKWLGMEFINATGTGLFLSGGLNANSVTTTDTIFAGGYASTTGGLFSQGDLYIGSDATITNSLAVGTLTSGECVQAGTGGLLTTTGSACGAGGGGGINDWKVSNGDLTPTTSIGLVFPSNATTTGWLNIGAVNGVSELLNSGDLFVGANATITESLIVSNGRVGIGTASPQELLHVGAGTDASDITATDLLVTRAGPSNLSVRDSTNNVEIFLFASSVGGVMGTVSNDPLNIKTNNTSAIFIDASQNVGIGDASPLSLFTVGSGDKFQVDSSGNATSSGWFNVGTTDVIGTFAALIGAGDLFIGNNATVTNDLFVLNNASTTGWFNIGTGNDGNIFGSGDLFVSGNATTSGQFNVGDDANTATTTVIFGNSDTTKGACLVFEDDDNTGGLTFCTTTNGAMNCGTIDCRDSL